MNGYTFTVCMIIVLLTSCIMPTLSDRLAELDKQADSKVQRLKDMGRM